MKDLEKIKSEDLGCQVADANPGNFGIEQEVGAMVGATVPAPTEPSADDARELGAQLLVFLRRALLPIRSALRTAVAAIYAHLDSRCTDYTPAAYASYQDPSTVPPYDPMRPLTPRTLPNLLTAITAFSDRKITGVPEAADGMSFLRVLCDSNYAASITELTDDNAGWTCDRNNIVQTLCDYYPNLGRVVFHCKSITQPFWYAQSDSNRVLDVIVYGCESINLPTSDYYSLFWSWYGDYGCPNVTLTIYGLEDGSYSSSCRRGMNCGTFNLPDYKRNTFYLSGWASYTVSKLHIVRAGCKGAKADIAIFSIISATNSTVTDFEIGDFEQPSNPRWVPCQSLNVSALRGLTAENMYNHILLRLKQDEPLCGSGVTITLGTTNIEKLEAVEEYNTKLTELEDTYGYTFA